MRPTSSKIQFDAFIYTDTYARSPRIKQIISPRIYDQIIYVFLLSFQSINSQHNIFPTTDCDICPFSLSFHAHLLNLPLYR
jgi:hypothetical protein